MRRIVFFAYLGIAIGVGLSACTSRISGSDQILAFAEEVYFGGPLDRHVVAERKLLRWDSALWVSIHGQGADRYRQQVAGHLADFTRLAGLPANFVDDPREANLVILLTGEDTYRFNGEASPCFARVLGDGSNIQVAHILVSVTEAAKVEHCLAHELYHAFGLRFHSTAAASILSPAHGNTRPTPADDLALSMLYDARLRPGAARPETTVTLRDLTSHVDGDFGAHWAAVTPTASRIQVLQNADKGYVSRYLRTRYPSSHLTVNFAYWRGPAAFQPVAVVSLHTTDPGYFFNDIPTLQRHVTDFGWLKTKSLQFGEQVKRKGLHGLLDTIEFQFDNTECLGFRQSLASHPIEHESTDLLFGYVCADPGASMDMQFVDKLLQNVKIQGVS